MTKLEETMSWKELAELTAKRIEENIIIYIKKNQKKKWNRQKFLEWFMERENVGYRFDYQLIYHTYRIWQQLMDEDDYFLVLCGAEGSGKSTLAFQLAAWISPNTFSLDWSCYNTYDYIKLMKKVAKEKEKNIEEKKTIVLDEAALDLFSREAMSLKNRWLSKSFFVQRFLNACVILCIPNFFMLDTVVRQHRVSGLLTITSRGYYKFIGKNGIVVVNRDGGKYSKNLNIIPIPKGHFFNGYFNIPFPKTISKEEYEKYKLDNIKKFLEEAQEESLGIKMVSASKVAKEMGMANSVPIMKMIKAGKIDGKQIGVQWYITKKSYDKLMSVEKYKQNNNT